MWFWCLGPLTGAAMVAILLYFIGPHIPMKQQLPVAARAAIGAFFGIFVMPYAVTPWLAARMADVTFHNEQ